MDIDLEAIARKVNALESKVSELEKAVKRYLKSSIEIRNLWKGKLLAVDEVRAMRRHARGY